MRDLDTIPESDAAPEPSSGGEGTLALDPGLTRSLGDFLFPAPARRNVPDIWIWWEKRRIPYNLIVGGVGGLAALYIGVVSSVLPGGPDFIPLQFFLAVGVAANVCYTLGAIIESLALKLFGRSLLPIGPALYRMGLTFSCGLPLIPAVVVTIGAVLTVLGLVTP